MKKVAVVEMLSEALFDKAEAMADEVRLMIRQAAEQLALCPCCGDSNYLYRAVGSMPAMEVLLVNALMAVLANAYDEVTVDLAKVLGSTKGLKAFREQNEFEVLVVDDTLTQEEFDTKVAEAEAQLGIRH